MPSGTPVADNFNIQDRGAARSRLAAGCLAGREARAISPAKVIPERRMHAKGSGAYGTFTVTHDITRFTKAKNLFKDRQTDPDVRPLLDRRGASEAPRTPNAISAGFALKFYTEEGNWDVVGNNRRCSSSAIHCASLTSITLSGAIRAPVCAVPITTGTSGRCCLRRWSRSS